MLYVWAFFFPMVLAVALTAFLVGSLYADASFVAVLSKLSLKLDLEVEIIASLEATREADLDAFLLRMLGSELTKELIV